ncbi:MAG: prepilin peptidase, partial [Myxococcales bacterium]|nr:prepilin peptidase [Myxococcales bacterium]
MTLEVLIPLGIAIAITAISAVTDTRTGHIPNWITFPPILLAPIGYGLFFGWYGFGQSVLGLLACGVVPYFMFWQGGMGGGDVKLFAALGALLGWQLG